MTDRATYYVPITGRREIWLRRRGPRYLYLSVQLFRLHPFSVFGFKHSDYGEDRYWTCAVCGLSVELGVHGGEYDPSNCSSG